MKFYNNGDSLLKTISYIGGVAKEPILINGVRYGYLPPLRVTITESFYYKDNCTMCGKCCLNNTQAWTDEGFSVIEQASEKEFNQFELDFNSVAELKASLEKRVLNVNGNDIEFWVCPSVPKSKALIIGWHDREPSPRCRWLFEKDGTYRCKIHPVRPITCGLPHIRFFQVEKTRHTTIGTSQFGRNFRLKCPVEFSQVDESSIATKIYWLKRLQNCADDLKIETFLPEIISYLENGGRSRVTFSANSRRKLF